MCVVVTFLVVLPVCVYACMCVGVAWVTARIITLVIAMYYLSPSVLTLVSVLIWRAEQVCLVNGDFCVLCLINGDFYVLCFINGDFSVLCLINGDFSVLCFINGDFSVLWLINGDFSVLWLINGDFSVLCFINGDFSVLWLINGDFSVLLLYSCTGIALLRLYRDELRSQD